MRRKILATAAMAAVVVTGMGIAVTGYADEKTAENLSLIEPTGERPVGTTTLSLKDETRDDIWVPAEKRRLMVSMYYPARSVGNGPTAQYMTPAESKLFLEGSSADVPPETMSKVRTHAVVDAKPDTKDDDLPLVVLSPGFALPRATLTGLAEDLASDGTIVAVVGHNYEAPMTMPDGTTNPCEACGETDGSKVVGNRAEDLSFVLDELTGNSSPWRGSKLIDDDDIALGGHSIGGASAHTTMLSDDRFTAGFNFDGAFHPEKGEKLNRPFMMLGSQKRGPGNEASWDDRWQKLTDWRLWLTVDATKHNSLTDLGLLGAAIGTPQQELDGERCTEIVRDYTAAFVDLHLRGGEAPILDGPGPDNPEVAFHNP